MVHVIAVITAKSGKREEVLRHFRANVPAVRAEKGCIEYGAAIDADHRNLQPYGMLGLLYVSQNSLDQALKEL